MGDPELVANALLETPPKRKAALQALVNEAISAADTLGSRTHK